MVSTHNNLKSLKLQGKVKDFAPQKQTNTILIASVSIDLDTYQVTYQETPMNIPMEVNSVGFYYKFGTPREMKRLYNSFKKKPYSIEKHIKIIL